MARVATQKGRYKYPTGTGQRSLSHRDIGVLTAEQGAIAEFAGLGGVIATQVGRKTYLADASAQAVEGIAEVGRRWNTEFDSYDDNPDYSTYNKSFEQTAKGLAEVTAGMSNPLGIKRVEEYITANMPIWEKTRNLAIEGRMKIGLLDSREISR